MNSMIFRSFVLLGLTSIIFFPKSAEAASFQGLKSDLKGFGINQEIEPMINVLGPLVQGWLGDFFEEDKSLSELDFSAAGIKSAHILIASADGNVVVDSGQSPESSVNFGLKEITAQSAKWSGTKATISGFQKKTAFTDPICVGDLNNYNTFSGVDCKDEIALHQKQGAKYLDTTYAATFGFVFGEGTFLIDGQEGKNDLYEEVPEPITGLVFAAGLGGAALKRAKDKSKKS